jgi:hypothetical protein
MLPVHPLPRNGADRLRAAHCPQIRSGLFRDSVPCRLARLLVSRVYVDLVDVGRRDGDRLQVLVAQPRGDGGAGRPPRKASGSSMRRRSPTSPCASPSCRRGMSRPQSTPARSSTTSPGWDSLSGGSRREKPGTLGRSDPANSDFWIFAGLTRAPTDNGRHAAADPRLHDQELQGVGYPYLRYPVQVTSALRNLAVSLCPSVNRAVRTCATREQDPSIPPLTCEFPGSVGSRVTPRPGSPTAITWPGTRRGSLTYG